MCNFYSAFGCINILKSCKLELYCSLNDSADFCTVCHMFDWILMDKIRDVEAVIFQTLPLPLPHLSLPLPLPLTKSEKTIVDNFF